MRFSEFVVEYREPREYGKAHRDGIDLEAWKDGLEFQINATAHDRDLGRVLFDVQYQGDQPVLVAKDLMILPEYRGQGIAAIMYDYAKELGYQVERSHEQTPAGKHFWDKNRGSKRVWESKTLDPELYGEMLPTATVKRIVTGVMNRVDPGATVTVKQSPEGYYIVRSEKLRLDFGITADGGDINANIVNAYSSYKGAGVVTEIFAQCFKAAEQLWGKPNRFVMSAHEDRGHGVWQHIAQKLGAEWEGSLNEIARIPQGDFGTAGTIIPPGPEVERKELPGGSGLTYGINRENDLLEIMIFDGDSLAGELDLVYTRGATKTWGVDTIAVDPAHRGKGVAKALYGIALSILKLPLEAGQMQTRHGQAMWLMLNSIPGVEVVGYDQVPTQRYQAHPGDQIVFQDKRNTGFTFPVRPGKHSMRSGRKGTGIYTSPGTTMIAKWTGQ